MRNAFRAFTSTMKQLALLTALAALAACSGGASTEKNVDTTANASALSINYAGPAPSSADVQAFKNEFWVNVAPASRCGGCHNQTVGQSPQFARTDDVNAAYQAALQVVNLAQPDQSRVVAKVAGGHNCWTSSASVCADIMTTWIRNWASASGNTGTGTQIQLVAPVDRDVGATKTFPTAASGFATTVYPLLTQYCAGCHTSNAATPQKPYFASSDVNEAYAEVHAKINLDSPALSRLYVRLNAESHNCWSNCTNNATTMLAAINAFVGAIPTTQIDPTLVLSKALTMYDGTIASGGNRYEAHSIARYFFKEGTGSVAYDTSGVDPATDLTLNGPVSWSGGWGLTVAAGGKAQATTTSSKKLNDRIKASGEYTIEAWVAPANVAQEDANIVSYSGGNATRNMTLGQHGYQYEAYARSSKSDANGETVLITRAADRDAQASLQHVVVTYDPVSGRKIYVNGVFTGDADSLGGGTFSNWDDTFALVLGNETSSTRAWSGLIKFVAIHDRALTLDQVQQNFAAGVGERYFLLFNVSTLTNVAQSYVMFEVTQYDSYSYLFNKPTFISLAPNAQPGTVQIKGMRIGINGTEAPVGQAYIPLDVTISNANYNAATGQLLSSVGTIIGLEKGPNADLFFLTFEQIGSNSRAYTDNTVLSTATPPDATPVSDMGYRIFEQIDATMSKITSVPRTNAAVKTTYNLVKQQLPTVASMEGFLSAHQIGIAQLGSTYCSELVNSSSLSATFFPGLNFSTATLGSSTERNLVIDPLLAKAIGNGLGTQPAQAGVRTEINNLMDKLCTSGGVCTPARTSLVVKAACTAVVASAAATIQ